MVLFNINDTCNKTSVKCILGVHLTRISANNWLLCCKVDGVDAEKENRILIKDTTVFLKNCPIRIFISALHNSSELAQFWAARLFFKSATQLTNPSFFFLNLFGSSQINQVS